MIKLINRGRYDTPVLEEFEHLTQRLSAFLTQIFDENGNLIPPDEGGSIEIPDVPEVTPWGGVEELVNNDLSFGTGENVKVVIITWVKPPPTNKNKIQFFLNNSAGLPMGANGGMVSFSWKVLSTTTVEVTRISQGGATLPFIAGGVNYTAIHHNIVGY